MPTVSEKKQAKTAGPTGRNDAALVRAALAGELKAFETLVERYQRQVTTAAYRLLNNRDDAMEIAQDAFLQAYAKLGTLSRPGRFAGWLMRIVNNLSLNRRRGRALRRTASLDAGENIEPDGAPAARPDPKAVSPLEAASDREANRRVAEEIDRLPQAQRQALVLFSIEKIPQQEVARILGCSVEAVKWRVFAARKRLRDALKDYL